MARSVDLPGEREQTPRKIARLITVSDHGDDGGVRPGARVIRTLLGMRHRLLRGALRHMLNAQEDIEVVAERDDLAATVADAQRYRPDVVVLDVAVLDRPVTGP